MFIAQNTAPLKRIAEMPTLQAINTPLEQRSAQYLQVAQQQSQDLSPQEQMRMPDPAAAVAPTQASPQMRVEQHERRRGRAEVTDCATRLPQKKPGELVIPARQSSAATGRSGGDPVTSRSDGFPLLRE